MELKTYLRLYKAQGRLMNVCKAVQCVWLAMMGVWLAMAFILTHSRKYIQLRG